MWNIGHILTVLSYIPLLMEVDNAVTKSFIIGLVAQIVTIVSRRIERNL
jgi:hypothetical protein